MKDFEILSYDTAVAVWEDNELKVLNNDLLPLYLSVKTMQNLDLKHELLTRIDQTHDFLKRH